jgi:hypothetical protein
MNYWSHLTVEGDGKGSKVVIKGSARMKGWWHLMEPLMRSEFKTGLRKELTSLKAVLEGRTSSPSA